MVVALGAGDPPQLGQAGWDPALPWEGNSSQWECELGKREHLLQHHQAPVHQQRPGQSFGSLVADLIFCQAAQKKRKLGVFPEEKETFTDHGMSQDTAGMVSREEPQRPFGSWYKVMDFLLGWTPGRDCKDTISGHKIHLCPIKELRWQHGELCAALRKSRRWGK